MSAASPSSDSNVKKRPSKSISTTDAYNLKLNMLDVDQASLNGNVFRLKLVLYSQFFLCLLILRIFTNHGRKRKDQSNGILLSFLSPKYPL